MSTPSLHTFSTRPIWRSIIALVIVGSFSYVCVRNDSIKELSAAAIIVINWYFQGQQQTNLLQQLNKGSQR
jgi:hypothetical protein